MVDTVSAEDRRQELLEDSLKHTYPDDTAGIKKRYKDTALVLFKEDYGDPKSFLSFGTRRSSSVSQYGNTPVIVRRSRSSNGELFTVAEQWPSIGARTSVSNYTLVETGERDKEESDTDDELDIAVKKLGELEDLKEAGESGGSLPEDDDVLSEKSKQSLEERLTEEKSTKKSNGDKEKEVTLQSGEYESRKSFMHYELPIQRLKSEKKININDEEQEEESDHVSKLNRTSETEGERNAIRDNNYSEQMSTDNSKKDPVKEDIQIQGSLNLSPTAEDISNDQKTSSIKYECIKVECHEENFPRKDTVSKESFGNSARFKSTSLYKEIGHDFSYTELKIVEPTDDEFCSNSINTRNFLCHSSGVQDEEEEDDDVEFVDAISPISPKIDIRNEKKTLLNLTLKDQEEYPSELDFEYSPQSSNIQDFKNESIPSHIADIPKNGVRTCDLDKSLDLEESTKFSELPVRSPTPPKKSPRRSPRSPKSKEASIERHSSFVIPLQTEPQINIPKGARSASPTTKTKEHGRIFTFSIKHEKSRSASSLNLRKGKDKDQSPQKDVFIESPSLSTDDKSDSQLESFGKRVGIRSMVIDGTIKRNFIVIHPSDESDTIGLAPKAEVSNGKENSHIKPSKALSSMKSHISNLTSSKIETIQKISLNKDIKEELRDTISSPPAMEPVPKLRSKKNRSNSKVRESTHSLASQTASDDQRESQVVSSGLSEVDCDSINVSSQVLNMNRNIVTSKLCIIM